MMTDNAPANLKALCTLRGGDTGRRRAEHRGLLLLWLTHNGIRNRSEAYIHFIP